MKKLPSIMLSLGIFLFAGVLFTQAAITTETVSGDTATGENQPGWLFNRDAGTSTPYTFNTDAASIGIGSLYIEPIGSNASDKFIAENFLLTPIADVGSVSYDFQIGNGGTVADANHFYMSVYANYGTSDQLKFYDCRYSVVPTTGSTTDFTTVTFDPTQSYPVATRSGSPTCPPVPADMGPDAFLRVFAINVGDTSVNDENLDGYLDNVVVTTDDDMTTYDFEPTVIGTDKDACKKGGWTTFNAPSFKNQGQCVSFVASQGKSGGNH